MSARDKMTDDEALAEYAHALISGEPYAGWPLTDEEADDETDASNAVGALFPRQEDPLADLREPERRASKRRVKPYGTVDPDNELHRNVRDIFLGRPQHRKTAAPLVLPDRWGRFCASGSTRCPGGSTSRLQTTHRVGDPHTARVPSSSGMRKSPSS